MTVPAIPKPGKRKKRPKVKTKGAIRKALIKKLDILFSKYIRQRDAGKGCITCGQIVPLQCGHFQSRKYWATRWDERNCAGQCLRDNIFGHGEQAKFARAIDRIYPGHASKELEDLARAKPNVKPSIEALDAMIHHYEFKLE